MEHPEKTAVRYARGERIKDPKPLLEHLAQCKSCKDMVLVIQEVIGALREEGKMAKERPSIEAVLKNAGLDNENIGEIFQRHFLTGRAEERLPIVKAAEHKTELPPGKMAKKNKLTRMAVKIGIAMGRADSTARKVAEAGLVAKAELKEISKQVDALKQQLQKTMKRLTSAEKK